MALLRRAKRQFDELVRALEPLVTRESLQAWLRALESLPALVARPEVQQEQPPQEPDQPQEQPKPPRKRYPPLPLTRVIARQLDRERSNARNVRAGSSNNPAQSDPAVQDSDPPDPWVM